MPAGNLGWEGDAGSLLPGTAKLSEKVELVYDSACGWGVKGTGNINAGAASRGLEGTIFFNKGL
jgi:hypothetical protein